MASDLQLAWGEEIAQALLGLGAGVANWDFVSSEGSLRCSHSANVGRGAQESNNESGCSSDLLLEAPCFRCACPVSRHSTNSWPDGFQFYYECGSPQKSKLV